MRPAQSHFAYWFAASLIAFLVLCAACARPRGSGMNDAIRTIYFISDCDCVDRGSWCVSYKPSAETWLVQCGSWWRNLDMTKTSSDEIFRAAQSMARAQSGIVRIGPPITVGLNAQFAVVREYSSGDREEVFFHRWLDVNKWSDSERGPLSEAARLLLTVAKNIPDCQDAAKDVLYLDQLLQALVGSV